MSNTSVNTMLNIKGGIVNPLVRARLEALEGILNGQVKVGPRGQKLYLEEIVELVRALD